MAFLQLEWRDKIHVFASYCLIKTGRLTFDTFTESELNDLLPPYFPITMPLDVPIGEGSITCLNGKLTMPTSTNRLTLTVLCAIEIRALGSIIYRAHIAVVASALPNYFSVSRLVKLNDVRIDSLQLLNDQYHLLKNTQYIIDKLTPLPISGVSSLLGQPIRSALNLLSAGSTEHVITYLRLYVQGNAQRVLDFHRPKIEQQLLNMLQSHSTDYQLNDDNWREFLFARWGKRVIVEDQCLRFYFTP